MICCFTRYFILKKKKIVATKISFTPHNFYYKINLLYSMRADIRIEQLYVLF